MSQDAVKILGPHGACPVLNHFAYQEFICCATIFAHDYKTPFLRCIEYKLIKGSLMNKNHVASGLITGTNRLNETGKCTSGSNYTFIHCDRDLFRVILLSKKI